MLSDFRNKININKNSNNYEKEELNCLNNIIENKNALNKNKTKLLNKENYLYLIKIINKTSGQEFINFLSFFNKINIHIHKIIINGYIQYDVTGHENNILDIISKTIDIYYNKDIFYFIYKKLSKIYRRHDLIKDFNCIKKINKLFTLWKMLYNFSKKILYNDLNNPNFIFFPNTKEENKNIEIEIKDANKAKNFTIIISFLNSPILDLNNINDKFEFIKIYNNENKFYILKLSDINSDDNNNKDIPLSKIFQIKFSFSHNHYIIDINEKQKIIEKKKVDFNFDSISKIEILNNFYGEIPSIIIEKEYSTLFKSSRKLKIELEKDILNDKIKIISNDTLKEIAEKETFDKNKNTVYKYYGIIFSIRVNCNNIGNIFKQFKKDLFNIEYYGGLNSFIPLFKIIKYEINSLKEINDKNKNNNNEKEKAEIYSEINNYFDKLFIWIKDILKLIIKLICVREKNFKYFKKIIVPLIGSIAEILHSLNNFDPLKANNIFNDELFHTLYIIILLSTTKTNIKRIFQNIIGINNNLDNLICSMDSLIFEIENVNTNSLYWYFTLIIMCIEFIMIYFNSSVKVPKALMNQLEKIMTFQNKGQQKEDKIKVITMKFLYGPIKKLYNNKNISESILEAENFLDKNIFYIKYVVYILYAFLNIKKISLLNKINLNVNTFYIKFLNLFIDMFNVKMTKSITKNKEYIKIVNNNVIYFPEENSLIRQLFPFFKQENYISKNELLMDELIDYHGQYHHLMKELFIFNRLWSNQKDFYHETLTERKNLNIKYKNINYYTRNFQRPIIYPVLDYKYRYPDFYNFKVDDKFYNIKEIEDDYNFDLDTPELDKYVEDYNSHIFEEIENNGKINVYFVCRVKQLYHVKGKLFIVCEGNKIILYFYSFSDNIQNEKNRMHCCNKYDEEKQNQKVSEFTYLRDYKDYLCYGALFKCSKKERNRIIKIKLDNIRMILKRIFYYQKSALELFTETKSYYFNFHSENKINDLFLLLIYPCEESYFPININNDTIGYMKINRGIIGEDNLNQLINKKNNFIEFISNKTSMGQLCEMCVFDIIMLLNLISNRSYNDLHQYPIFPALYFYDKDNSISKRDFKEHIGFQNITEDQKTRKNLYLLSYNESTTEINDFEENDNDIEIKSHLFNTHYSNIVYTSNFMIRLFPYSFCAIEMQGNGFDNPNRLFHYIQDTLYNICVQKSDLRELIPEFFYLPEMFMNINNINYQKRSNGELVDDIIIPSNISERNNESQLKNKTNYDKMFIFVDDLKTQLEYLEQGMSSWINLIFGTRQRIDINEKKQYFRYESYIDLNGVDYSKYVKDDLIMNSCDFGIMPLQTIFETKILENLKNRKNTYENSEGIHNDMDEQNNDILVKKRRLSKKESMKLEDKNNKNDQFLKQNTVILDSKKNKITNNNSIKIDDNNNQLLKHNTIIVDDKNQKPLHQSLKIDETKNKLIKQTFNKNNNTIEINKNTKENDIKKSNTIKKKGYAERYSMKDNYLNDEFWDEKLKFDFKINNDYDIGKLELYNKNILIKEIMDHNDKIIDFFYNRRLNMFATTSFDGFACIYILPNKLFSVIKNLNDSYFNRIFLSSNPYPTIITFEKKSNTMSSYSLSGLLITNINVEPKINVKIEINPMLNIYGGNIRDQVKVSIITKKSITNQIYTLPLFDQDSEELIIKK